MFLQSASMLRGIDSDGDPPWQQPDAAGVRWRTDDVGRPYQAIPSAITLSARNTAASQMATSLKLDRPQVFFHVKDMTSERAAEAVVGALKNLDVGATVRIDLPLRRVEIEPDTAEPAALRDAITKAGYSSVRQWPSDCAYLWA